MRRLLVLAFSLALTPACGPAGHDDAGASSSALSARARQEAADQVTICHATASATNPYVVITIDESGLAGHFPHHAGDYVSADGSCPGGAGNGGGPAECRTTADCPAGLTCVGGACVGE